MAHREQLTDEELLRAIEEAESPVVTARMLAESVGMSRQGVHARLEDLREQGEVQKMKPGSDAFWWIEESSATAG